MTVRLPRLPAPGQTVLGGSLLTGPGGKGANQAVASARAGAEVVFVTAVGDDDLGRHALDGYRREGIDIGLARTYPGVASGVALILVGERGENMIGVAPGANALFGPCDVDRLPDDLFRRNHVLLIAGLELPLAAVVRAVERGARAGMTVVLNPAPIAEGLQESGVLAAADVLTPNRVELGELVGTQTADEDGLLAAAHALTGEGTRAAIITIGAEGCLVLVSGEVQRIAPHVVKAEDTVGAGDAFNGALAVALAEGRPLASAAAWANAAAALAVTRPGAQSSLPSRAEIDRFATGRGLVP